MQFPLLFMLILFRVVPTIAQEQDQPQDKQMHHQHEMPKEEEKTTEVQTGISLEKLQEMALQQSPSIRQAEAAVQAAEGRLKQAGLYPNPTVGYLAEELAWKDPGSTSEHMFFAEQNVLLGGKRGKAQDVFKMEVQQTKATLEAQKIRLRNAVRTNYYKTLAAQIQVGVRKKLADLSQTVVRTTNELFNVGSADEPDVLEAEVEAEVAKLAAEAAELSRQTSWKKLAATIGSPEMPLQKVGGSFEQPLPELNGDALLADLLSKSPQILAAEFQLQKAQAAIGFAKSQRVPDLRLRGGFGYNYEPFENTNRPVGWESFLEVGFPLPLFNRNQGNIAVAKADISRAEQEIRRVKAVVSAQFAEAFADYQKAKTATEKYRTDILPKARKAYDLYLTSFQNMAAAYPQVLIAQRNLHQLEIQYVALHANAWISASRVEDFSISENSLESQPEPVDLAAGESDGGSDVRISSF